MEWQEVTPEQDNWIKQINVTAFYGDVVVGSIVFLGEDKGWNSLIDGSLDYMDAETEEEAKDEMVEELESHFEDEINYYKELLERLEDLRKSEG